jgi:hypothetical protein
MSYENFLAILDEASGTPDRKPSHWLDTPLTRIWFEAAAANPTTMASNQFTASDFKTVTANAPTQDAAALYLHLVEHVRSQAMWDHSFYKADSAVLPKVLQFGKWCCEDANLVSSDGKPPPLGFTANVFRNPGLLLARIPSIANWRRNFKWDLYAPDAKAHSPHIPRAIRPHHHPGKIQH